MMQHKSTHDVDVLVLGAGVSGLAAAYTLSKKKKLRIAVLEARERIGGRVYSAALPGGLVGEHGAEWIGVHHKHLRRLCAALGVALESHTYKEDAYIHESTRLPDAHFRAVVKKMQQVFAREKNIAKLDTMSLLAFLNKHFTPGEVAMLRTLYGVDFGDDARYVSAARARLDHETGGRNDHMDFHVRGGNTRLMNALRDAIGADRIFLGHEVTSITQERSGVTVKCQNGSVWRAKKVLCTLPAQVVAKTHFIPALPAHTKRIAANLQYGNIVKVLLTFPRRFWVGDDFSLFSDGVAQSIYHATKGQPGRAGTLCLYAVGARADKLSRMSMPQVWSALKKTLPSTMDTKGVMPISMERHVWAEDPFAHGAYAVCQPKEWARVRNAFGKTFHHVYFSGEHLAIMQGFMEGAATTGIDAAKAIIKALRNKRGPSQMDAMRAAGKVTRKTYSYTVTESQGPRNKAVRHLWRS